MADTPLMVDSPIYGPPVPLVLKHRAARLAHRRRAYVLRDIARATLLLAFEVNAITANREAVSEYAIALDQQRMHEAAAGAFGAGLLDDLADEEDMAADIALERELESYA